MTLFKRKYKNGFDFINIILIIPICAVTEDLEKCFKFF